MRRFLLGFLLALAIAVPAGALGAATKDAIFGTVTADKATVTDLEQPVGGGGNLGIVSFHGNTSSAAFAGFSDTDWLQLVYSPGLYLNVSPGTTDPTVSPCRQARTGSLYLEHANDTAGAAFVKVAADACGWQKIAG